MLGVGVTLLAATAWVGWRAYQAYQHLNAAQRTVSTIEAEFHADGISDPTALVSLTGRIADETAAARDAVQDPVYRAATVLPWLGSNLDAVRQVALTIDTVAQAVHTAAPTIASLDRQQLFPGPDRIDVPSLRTIAQAAISVNAAVTDGASAIDEIDRRHLVGSVATAVTQVHDKLDELSSLTSGAAKAAGLAVPMLGGDGPRNYLVVFQNSAELRATGGIFGSYAILHINDGAVSLEQAGSTGTDFGIFDSSKSAVDRALTDLYSPLIATYPHDVNFTPDFPTAAQLIAQMYHARTGKSVNGVLAIDPTVVSVLLRGVPPIPLGHGLELTSDSAVKVLLSDLYAVFPTGADNPERDALLALATARAFSALLDHVGQSDLAPLVSDMKELLAQRRVMLWSSSTVEEADLVSTALGGRLLPDTPGHPTVGVFFNDGTGAKLDYYLKASARLEHLSCEPGGPATSALAVTLTDTSPPTGLPDYVVGDANVGKSYRLQTNVLIVAPTGGSVSSVTVDGRAVPVLEGVDHGRVVAMTTVVMTPGQTATVTATLTMPGSADPATGRVEPKIVATPMAEAMQVHTAPLPACSTER